MTKPRSPTTWERFNTWLEDMDGKISNHFFIPKYGYIIAFACIVKIAYNAVSIGLLAYQKHHNALLTDQGHVLVRWAIIQSAVLMVWLFYMFFFTTCWRYLEEMLQDMGPFGWKERKSPGGNSYNSTNGRWKGARSLNMRYVKEKEFTSNWSDTPSEQRAWVAYTFESLSPDPQRAAHQTAWLRKELLARVGSFKKREEESFSRNTLLDNQDGTVWDHGVVDVVGGVVEEVHQIPNINDHIHENDDASPEEDHEEEHQEQQQEQDHEQQEEHVVVEVSPTSTPEDPRPNPFETPPEPSHLSNDLCIHTIPPIEKPRRDKTKNVTTATTTKPRKQYPIPSTEAINYDLLWSAQLAELSAGRGLCESFWIYSLYSQIPNYYWSGASFKKDMMLFASSIYAICSMLFHYAWLMYGTNEITTLSKAGSVQGALIKSLTPFVWKYSLAVLVIEWTYSTALIITIFCSLFDV